MNVSTRIEGSTHITDAASMAQSVLIIGGGPVGTRAAQELSRRGKHVTLLNAERWRPYNRVKLTPLLAGEAQLGQVYTSEYAPRPGKIDRYDGVAAVDIDQIGKKVLGSNGRSYHYDKLIFAMGSRAFVPNIDGSKLAGVYSFRNFDDTEALIARSMSARDVVVIGGGLLGLEAARGMAKRGAKVTVVEHENRLMPRQLDLAAGETLKDRIEAIGIDVVVNQRVQSIDGDSRAETITLGNGEQIKADTVIVCTGVRANTQLPAAIGIAHNRGVIVDDHMCTSDPNIYAIGECAEHAGHVYGLVGPGYEQCNIAVASICGEEGHLYVGSTPTTKLKVVGADVFSIGDFESIEQQPGVKTYIYQDIEKDIYRRIIISRGKLVAALGVGDWPEATKLQQAVSAQQSVWPWQTWRFARSGELWADNDDSIANWPKEAIVCNCTGVTKGAIADSITLGAANLDEVRTATSANSVCGSCKPLIHELLGQGDAKPEPVKWWKALVVLSGLGALAALTTLIWPRIAMLDTYVVDDFWFDLWFDTVWKQYSGYTLLGLSVAAALIGLRKRIGFLSKLGGYQAWRLIHLVIGFAATLVLVWHTGFRLGSNLNFLLMASFLLTLIFGAIAGLITGGEHEIKDRGFAAKNAKPRTFPMWVHVLAVWPLPVLIAIHVLVVYMY